MTKHYYPPAPFEVVGVGSGESMSLAGGFAPNQVRRDLR